MHKSFHKLKADLLFQELPLIRLIKASYLGSLKTFLSKKAMLEKNKYSQWSKLAYDLTAYLQQTNWLILSHNTFSTTSRLVFTDTFKKNSYYNWFGSPSQIDVGKKPSIFRNEGIKLLHNCYIPSEAPQPVHFDSGETFQSSILRNWCNMYSMEGMRQAFLITSS